MRQTTRLGAYGVLRDDNGRVLLQHMTAVSQLPDSWWLPGGGVEHGEHPADAVVREFAEETGLDVEVAALREIVSDLTAYTPEWSHHHLAVIYDLKLAGGTLARDVVESDAVNVWTHPSDIEGSPVSPVIADVLGVTGPSLPTPRWERQVPASQPSQRRRRIGSYAWITDADGRVLLTLIAEGSWGAGLWHLPGGGIDFGETPERCVLREIHEETDQDAVLGELRCVSSKHDRESTADDGEPEDFPGVSIVYTATIATPKPLRILDIGGSTSDVRWFHPGEIADLPLTLTAQRALASD